MMRTSTAPVSCTARSVDAATSPYLPPPSQWTITRLAPAYERTCRENLESIQEPQASLVTTASPVMLKQSFPRRLKMSPSNKKFPAQSPMSMCIATIMGAAEAVDKQDVLMFRDAKETKRKHAPQKEQQRMGSHEKPTTTTIRPSDSLEAHLADHAFFQRLIYTTALERPRVAERAALDLKSIKIPPAVIGGGFYWKDYPYLESLLLQHMEEYYEIGTNKRQSKYQQYFNNALVEKVREVASSHGNEFDALVFDDRRLRDRIRCFYKTHLQNAKRRLNTMIKNVKRHRLFLITLVSKTHNPPKRASARLVSVPSD